ncbi:hypothetical protein RTG_01519 [Rhodotorula toruloides ATCC 204091]|uniref:Smg-4/UPF3 family-domain containing protein n=1 Tax=Rhodotorula toruloides TaxID=5286 RepID=A0A0K3CGY6_RHOTO|nr:hypothetical protein RTG_01519 [Rhodotorula toruloides ATCC 204091]KAK4332993.1 Smg-4/UPF3 family-domain containing protein [Rhodotorula toruloides]PRQ73642.1 Smg-4/UPF3 family-domain containing protein [Rhodotorula toruloides]
MAPTKSGSKSQGNQRLKLVVRRLPPDLPPAVFWKTVSPWVTREDVDDEGQEGAEKVVWSEYKQGKVRRSGKDKDSVQSRAYITFRTPDALVAFSRGYDGWSFRDKTGNVSQAVVEFAPYQRIPTAPAKADPRQGTIDDDPDFLAFQEALTAAPATPQPAETPAVNPKSTPLLEYLRQQKAAFKASRKQALAAIKGKGPVVLPGATKAQLATAVHGGVQAPAGKGAKGGKKDKAKEKKGKGKSKESSRSATPVPGAAASGSGAAKGGKSSKPPTRPASAAGGQATPPAPHIPYPPGSVGAQQQQAQRNAALQAQQVRQQLQQQHRAAQQQQRAAQPPQQPQPTAILSPQPQMLRNPARPMQQTVSPAPPATFSSTPAVQLPRPPPVLASSAPPTPAGGAGGQRGRGRGGGRGGGDGGGRGGRGRGRARGRGGAAAAGGPPAGGAS